MITSNESLIALSSDRPESRRLTGLCHCRSGYGFSHHPRGMIQRPSLLACTGYGLGAYDALRSADSSFIAATAAGPAPRSHQTNHCRAGCFGLVMLAAP